MLESPIQIVKDQVKEKPVKIVVYGSQSSGKTTLIRAIDPGARQVGSADSTGRRAWSMGGMFPTTVAFDLGIVNAGSRSVYIYGAPGDGRCKIAMSIVSADIDIGLVIIDGTVGVTAYEKRAIKALKDKKIPFIALANKMDMPEASIETVIKGLDEDIPLLPVSAKTGYGLDMLWNALADMIERREY